MRCWPGPRSNKAFIIEDDYDGELKYEGRPLKALAGLRPVSRVIYCGTFAKTLFPALRLGFVVLPESLVDPVVHAKWLSDRGSSPILQRLVRDLMVSGEFDRHVRRLRRRFETRRDALVRALKRHFGADVEIAGRTAGLHVIAWLPRLRPRDTDALIAGCEKRGVAVYSVAPHAIRPLRRAGLMMGYGLIDEKAIARGVRVIAEVYRELSRRRTYRSSR